VKHVRNVAIILALAALLFAARGRAGPATSILLWLLNLTFLGVLAWFVAVMYRTYRVELLGLTDRTRAVLYGSAGVVALTLTATSLLWRTGPGTIVWFGLLAAASLGFVSSWRAYRRY
jgi:hypothetical protein